MAYSVTYNAPDSRLGNADVVFTVTTNEGKLGELHISKGALAWKPFYSHHSYKLNWQDFARLAEEQGKKAPGT
ncbi:MAG: hypothetical protein C1O27_000676 [Chloroflexi bacterium]|nr:MAG: hypothetical protein C1O27_000676 [Chloroflexota bacterium]